MREIGRFARRPGRVPVSLAEVVVAAVAGVAAVVGSYAAVGVTPEFVVAPVEATLARTMPGVAVTFAVTVLGDLGQRLNLLTAVGLTVGGLGSLMLAARWLAHGPAKRAVDAEAPVAGPVAVVGTAVAVATAVGVVTTSPRSAVGAAGAAALVVAFVEVTDQFGSAYARVAPWVDADASHSRTRADPGRRGVLAAVGGLVATGAAAVRVAPRTSAGGTDEGDGEDLPEGVAGDRLRLARDRSLDVEGLEPLVSDKFYTVDINSVDPDVDAEDWSLTVTGAVAEETTVSYDDLAAMDSREEFVTLRCVGEDLNGKKMDNALWTVVDVMPLLERAGVPDECCVMARAADDYFEEFPLPALEGAMLAYRMNGEPLPRGHGAPVRLLVPGHWGEINVKWLTEIEVLAEPAKGYWEKRGWHGTGPVKTVAKLHARNRLDDGRIEVGGHAYAGTRGIDTVEVSTDGGETWATATLSDPLPGEDVWRQWVYRYDPPDDAHEVVVRAVDGTGTVQPEERSGQYPSGATGWVSRTVRP